MDISTVSMSRTAIVDLNVPTGAVKHGATGFLYGPADEGVPTDTTMAGIAPMDLMVAKAPHGIQHPNGDVLDVTEQFKRNGGNDIQIYMKDFYPNFPYAKYDEGGMQGDYVPKIKAMVTEVLEKFPDYVDSFVWIPFNESDINDYNYGNLDGEEGFNDEEWNIFLEDWDIAYRTINETYRQVLKDDARTARVAGPNLGYYNDKLFREFFAHTKREGTVPQVVTWHELPKNGDKSGFYKNYSAWMDIKREVLGSDCDVLVSINEYSWMDENGDPIEQSMPGSLLQYIARFERAKVQAALPYWYPCGDLDWLVTHNNQVTGSWWLYHWYGQMEGQTVQVTLPDQDQKTQVLACYEADAGRTKILFGGGDRNAESMCVDIAVANFADKYPQGAHVTVFGIDATAPGNGVATVPAASEGPFVVDEYNVDAHEVVGLRFDDLKPTSAYYAIVTPKTSQNVAVPGVLQAGFAHVRDSSVMYGDAQGYEGVGYIRSDVADAEASFFITAVKNGYYDLSLRYSAPQREAMPESREVTLRLNQGDEFTLQLPQTQDEADWRVSNLRIYLPLGINEVTIAGYGASDVRIDSLGFVPADDDAVTKYEAEGAVLSGKAEIVDLVSASGGQIVANVGNGTGNGLAFDAVEASADGDYTVTISYAQAECTADNPGQTVSRWADLAINGIETTSVVFANTRDWNDYWTTSVRVHLTKGLNTLTFSNARTGSAGEDGARSGWAPNFDYITVAPTVVGVSVESGVR